MCESEYMVKRTPTHAALKSMSASYHIGTKDFVLKWIISVIKYGALGKRKSHTAPPKIKNIGSAFSWLFFWYCNKI